MKTKLLALLMISSLALTACAFDDDDNTPKSQGPLKENDKKDENKKDENKKDENKKDESKKDESKKDENKKDENKKDENKKDENKKDENKQDDPKPDTPFTMKQQRTQWKITLKGEDVTAINTTPTYPNVSGDGDNYKKLVIDGMTIDLPDTLNKKDEQQSRRVEVEKDGVYYAPIAPNINERGTAYARYGLVYSGKSSTLSAFYQGKPTEINNMPPTGSATYKGYAIAVDTAEMNKFEQGESDYGEKYGLSEFTADFKNKKLTGTLSNWQNKATTQPKTVNISADIRANTFKGTANKTGSAEGKFYGPKAQNLAGAFNDKSQNLQGVFGANKQ